MGNDKYSSAMLLVDVVNQCTNHGAGYAQNINVPALYDLMAKIALTMAEAGICPRCASLQLVAVSICLYLDVNDKDGKEVITSLLNDTCMAKKTGSVGTHVCH